MITLLEAQRTLIYTADSKGKNKDIEIENKHHRHHTRDSLGPLPNDEDQKPRLVGLAVAGFGVGALVVLLVGLAVDAGVVRIGLAVVGFGEGFLVVLLVGLAVSSGLMELVGFVVGTTTMADLVGLAVKIGLPVARLVGVELSCQSSSWRASLLLLAWLCWQVAWD